MPREFPLEGRFGPFGPLPGSGRAGNTCCRDWPARLRFLFEWAALPWLSVVTYDRCIAYEDMGAVFDN